MDAILSISNIHKSFHHIVATTGLYYTSLLLYILNFLSVTITVAIMSTELVRIIILINKLDTISYEQFHKYWSTEHPNIWLSVPIVQGKIVKYSQFHGDHEFKAKMGEHLPFAKFDGIVEMWAKSYDDLLAVSTTSTGLVESGRDGMVCERLTTAGVHER